MRSRPSSDRSRSTSLLTTSRTWWAPAWRHGPSPDGAARRLLHSGSRADPTGSVADERVEAMRPGETERSARVEAHELAVEVHARERGLVLDRRRDVDRAEARERETRHGELSDHPRRSHVQVSTLAEIRGDLGEADEQESVLAAVE